MDSFGIGGTSYDEVAQITEMFDDLIARQTKDNQPKSPPPSPDDKGKVSDKKISDKKMKEKNIDRLGDRKVEEKKSEHKSDGPTCIDRTVEGVLSVCGKTYESMDAGWIDCGDYFLNTHNQGTDGWHSARREGLKLVDGSDNPVSFVDQLLTASNYAKAAGISPYETKESYIIKWTLGIRETFDLVSQGHLARGTKNEPVARLMYEDVKSVIVKEVGLAIPKWDLSIGSSVDGMVGEDGLIEIKCPEYIYDGYAMYSSRGVDPLMYVKKDHYAQMQGGMAILNRKWCDYVVYGVKEGALFIVRITFNKSWWSEYLYPKLRDFISEAKYIQEIVKSQPVLQELVAKVKDGSVPFGKLVHTLRQYKK